MTLPRTTIWEAEPHTIAKHAILRAYLEAWFPILSRWNTRVVYYDGFAGPGRYVGGEVGSPLIALDVAINHKVAFKSDLVFVFVEEDLERKEFLEAEIKRLTLPSNFKCQVINDTFDSALRRTLDGLDKRGLKKEPTFAFVDPFGFEGIPFELVRRLLNRKSCEVFITFVTSAIERFVSLHPNHINALIGLPNAAEEIMNANDRVLKSRELYCRSLRAVARFVRFFHMLDRNDRSIYDLFFASNSREGHYKMKEAMWKVDNAGDFRFSDGTDPNQMSLIGTRTAFELCRELANRFRGQTVYSDELLTHTRDNTPYLKRHYSEALKLLEAGECREEKIEVDPIKRDGKKRRRGTFPEGVRITFH